MHVLVTGGAGYLGSLLVPKLLERGDRVTVLDNFLWGVDALLPVAAHKSLNIVKGDVRDQRAVRDIVKTVDAVVNLAAIVGYPACAANPTEARTVNLDGARNVAENLSPHQMFIQASTGSTYGAVDEICTEDTPINPLTLYGETKAEAEKFCLDKAGVPLRFATVFGVSPRLRLDLLVNDITHQAVQYGSFVMYEGHARRTFLHSTDAAASVVFTLANYERMSGRPYNVGDESLNYTKSQVAELIKEQHNYYLHRADVGEDKDKRDYAVSYERIKALGYRAQVSMEEGIAELVKVCRVIHEKSNYRNI